MPIDTAGVNILEGMQVFGHDDAPHGHMHIKFDNVRVPKENMLLGEGRGFEFLKYDLVQDAYTTACVPLVQANER